MDIRQAVEQFVDCYHSLECLTREQVVETGILHIQNYGDFGISKHDSKFGRTVWLVHDEQTGLFQAK